MRAPLFAPLAELPDFDPAWCSNAREHMVRVEREGAGAGSLTDDGLRYWVLDGVAVTVHAPELWQWAIFSAVPIASAIAGKPLRLVPEMQVAVNVNCLEERGEQYELHTDSVLYTMLVWASGPHVGGELLCELPGGSRAFIHPAPGGGVLFEGSSIPHAVMPLRERGPRYSVPIAFEPIGEEFDRDPALSDHLYASTQS